MPILPDTVFIARSGTFQGMPTFTETGFATEGTATRNELKQYETGRVVIRAIPRTRGLVAKSLDGRPVTLATLNEPATMANTGEREVPNCLQLGYTTIEQVSPSQPAGCPNGGKIILRYTRQFVQLADDA